MADTRTTNVLFNSRKKSHSPSKQARDAMHEPRHEVALSMRRYAWSASLDPRLSAWNFDIVCGSGAVPR